MALQLLGEEVLFGDLHLLLVGVAGQLDDLHPIQQGAGDGVGGVGGGDEHDLGQVEGDLQKVVPEGGILLPVQHLQQGGGGIPPVVPAQLVDLVQEDEGVAALGLVDGGNNPAGHGAYIGLPVTTNFRLVADPAQGDAGQLPVHGPGHGHGDGGLAHPRRAHQADDLPLQVGGQLADGHKLQHPLFYLVQAEVVLVQRLLDSGDIHLFLGGPAPGQLQADVQIVAQDGALRGAVGLLGQPAQLLVQLLPHRVGELGLVDLLPVLLDFIGLLPQLGLDGLHLLPQVVVPLVVAHSLTGPLLNLLVQGENLHLPLQQTAELLQTSDGTQLLQDGLLVAVAHGDVLGDIVGDVPRVLAGQHMDEQIGGQLGGELGIVLEHLIGGSNQSFCPGAPPGLGDINLLHLRFQMGVAAQKLEKTAPGRSLYHHPHIVPGHPEYLTDVGDGAHLIQVVRPGLLHPDVLLAH